MPGKILDDAGSKRRPMKETELYLPVKRFLESQGYQVKSEIGDCDVMAVRGDEAPVVVELKLTFNIEVLLQAIDRLGVSQSVYIGVPAGNRLVSRRRRHVVKLMRMLGAGLLLIDADKGGGSVEVVLDPGEYKPRKPAKRQGRLLGEFARRVGDPNLGGASKKRGLMTAYRQRALAIARRLKEAGPTKAHDLALALGDKDARTLLYRDVYGWFERTKRGVYALSPRGERELDLWSDKG